jgi:hypothetical protein
MKQLIPALMLLGVTGTSWAQVPSLPLDAFNGADLGSALSPQILVIGFNNIDDATNAFVSGEGTRGGGMRAAGLAVLNPDGTEGGNVTQGFNNGNPAFQGFAMKLSNGTPASPLADAFAAGTDMVYGLLLPAYIQMDGPTEMLVSAGEPLTRPLYDALIATTFGLDLNFDDSGLPGLSAEDLGELPPLPSDMLPSGSALQTLP